VGQVRLPLLRSAESQLDSRLQTDRKMVGRRSQSLAGPTLRRTTPSRSGHRFGFVSGSFFLSDFAGFAFAGGFAGAGGFGGAGTINR
jgi:hypothetical protein